LFAAGEGSPGLLATLPQHGKEGEYPFKVLLDAVAVSPQVGPQIEVFAHGKQGEYHASFRNLADAHLNDVVGPDRRNGLASVKHITFQRRENTTDGHQGGGLAGAVAANETDDFTFIDFQGDAFQGSNIPVIGLYVFQLKQHWRLRCPDRPR
jgi:hypothetical protein